MGKKFHIWQNGQCITYLLRLRQMEDYFLKNEWEKTNCIEEADCVLIGACAAFEPYYDYYAKKVGTVSLDRSQLIVYGCLPMVNPKFYKENTDASAVFIPSRHPERIEDIIEPKNVAWKDIEIPSEFRKIDYSQYSSEKRFILIQEGCTAKCIYCPHLTGIGRAKSRPMDDILKQIRSEIVDGGRILILEGNDGGSWGVDLNPKQTYSDLIEAILSVGEEFVLHVGDFAPKWVRCYKDCLNNARISDIKIPIQTTSSRLLKLMGRDPYAAEMAPFLKSLRKASHKPNLRTEIIIGFPTSTENELRDTLEFVAECFHNVACFSYDFHPNTKIARMDIPFLDERIVRQHVQIAMDFAEEHPDIRFAFNDRGKICAELTKTYKMS